MQKLQLQFNTQIINYELHRKRVKNINIRIKTGGIVYVSAPNHISIQNIESILLKRAEWILQVNEKFNQREKEKAITAEIQWVDSDPVIFLGKTYSLKIHQSSKNHVVLDEHNISLYIKDPLHLEQKKQLYETWLRKQAQEIFLEIMEEQLEIIKAYKQDKPILKIRKMKARWGTCFSKTNTIQLNLELIKKPRAAIEYVVLHELAHFIHPNHSKAFYDFIATFMPDWKERTKTHLLR